MNNILESESAKEFIIPVTADVEIHVFAYDKESAQIEAEKRLHIILTQDQVDGTVVNEDTA